jgi:hypothetical protein
MASLFASMIPPQNALSPFVQFVKSIAIAFINSVQAMIFAAGGALFAKGITTFGLSMIADAPLLAAAWVALEAAKGFIGGFADGGLFKTSGNRSSDSGMARLSNNEFIVNSRATANNLPALQAMNSGASFQSENTEGVYISADVLQLLKVVKGANQQNRQRTNWKRF